MSLPPEQIVKELDLLLESPTKIAEIFGGHVKSELPGPRHRTIICAGIKFEYEFLDEWNYKMDLNYRDNKAWRESIIPYKNENEVDWIEFFKESFDVARCEYSL